VGGLTPHTAACRIIIWRAAATFKRFHRGLKEEEVWAAQHGPLHAELKNRTPHEAFLAFKALLKNEALTV
jgi:hypothetical protein